MTSPGVMFPGQGSQRAGQGLDFKERFPEAAETFSEASEALGWDVAQVCGGQDERLNLTEFTQPCVLSAEIAMFRVLQKHHTFSPVAFAGHSLGEYTALVAAGALPFASAVRIVHQRGQLMQSSIAPGRGAMSAVIMTDLDVVEIERMAANFGVDVANDNSPNQVVISGATEKVAEATVHLHDFFGYSIRIVPLTVSAPFHSRWMRETEDRFVGVLEPEAAGFNPARAIRVLSNFTGDFHTGRLSDLVDSLTRQISGRVRWRDNLAALSRRCDSLFEIGPTRPLSGFCKTMNLSVTAVMDCRSAERAMQTPMPVAQPQTELGMMSEKV